MTTPLIKAQPPHFRACMICGVSIHLIQDQSSIAAFLGVGSHQRRAFQCINCGVVICKACRSNGGKCPCRSNAWIARPSLGAYTIGKTATTFVSRHD